MRKFPLTKKAHYFSIPIDIVTVVTCINTPKISESVQIRIDRIQSLVINQDHKLEERGDP